MNILLWVIQGLLAAMFLMAGLMKLAKSKKELKPKMGSWVDALSPSTFKLIGLLEFLGAIGIVLPIALDIVPVLSPIAAAGLAFTMLVAMIFHLKRGEKEDALKKNLPFLLLALFVVIGRLIILPLN